MTQNAQKDRTCHHKAQLSIVTCNLIYCHTARVTVVDSVCLCVCLHLFSHYRNQTGSLVISTALAQQALENISKTNVAHACRGLMTVLLSLLLSYSMAVFLWRYSCWEWTHQDSPETVGGRSQCQPSEQGDDYICSTVYVTSNIPSTTGTPHKSTSTRL